jgi:hypothetical protein
VYALVTWLGGGARFQNRRQERRDKRWLKSRSRLRKINSGLIMESSMSDFATFKANKRVPTIPSRVIPFSTPEVFYNALSSFLTD